MRDSPDHAGRRNARLGIDGPVLADSSFLADAVAAELEAAAVPVARVSTEDFMRARSIRFEYGRDDPDACYDLWYDFPALNREVLEPLAPGGRGSWLPTLRDRDTDRSTRAAPRVAQPGTVAVVSGRFLARDVVHRSGLDLLVHLSLSPAALRRKVAEPAVIGAWERYLADDDPTGKADVVLRFDHPDRPALISTATPR